MTSALANLRLSDAAYSALIAECKTPDPRERVGLLAGRDANVERFFPLTNHDQGRNRFVICPQEMSRQTSAAQALGLSIIGRFHTHPNGPRIPSPADLASLPAGWVELIAQVKRDGPRNRLIALSAFDGQSRGVPLTIPQHVSGEHVAVSL